MLLIDYIYPRIEIPRRDNTRLVWTSVSRTFTISRERDFGSVGYRHDCETLGLRISRQMVQTFFLNWEKRHVIS
jgi:hypothetical protein